MKRNADKKNETTLSSLSTIDIFIFILIFRIDLHKYPVI